MWLAVKNIRDQPNFNFQVPNFSCLKNLEFYKNAKKHDLKNSNFQEQEIQINSCISSYNIENQN